MLSFHGLIPDIVPVFWSDFINNTYAVKSDLKRMGSSVFLTLYPRHVVLQPARYLVSHKMTSSNRTNMLIITLSIVANLPQEDKRCRLILAQPSRALVRFFCREI